ncbi:MAG TPA: hypothetical protein VE978_05070 [Chitinophagales bacterium]|nr:hypothetical protein [Chitinophagales bacterium]
MSKPFKTPQKIILNPAIIIKAKKFSESVVSTIDYKDSNQSNIEKIRDDHFISKLGEEAVKKLMEERGNKVIGPDYTIYPAKKKSWSTDLMINEIEVAVKTQKKSAANKYGLSWTFQFSQVRKDPILKNPEAWICFVEYDDTDEKYSCRVFPPRKMKSLPLKEPKLQHLKGKKKVVYANDLL